MKKQVIIDILFTVGAGISLILFNNLFGLSIFAGFALIPILIAYHIGKYVGRKYASAER